MSIFEALASVMVNHSGWTMFCVVIIAWAIADKIRE